MNEQMTHADFARRCAFIASEASSWAGDVLTLPEDAGKPITKWAVARFLEGMRARLDYLEKSAGIAPTKAPS